MNTEEYVKLLLEQRGMTTEESRRRFLEFSENDLRRAADMEGGAALLSRLEEAVNKQENVTVYGDYDADGVMASCIFYMGLVTLLPGKTACFINNRFDDGYDITAESMAKLFDLFPETKIVLTCDNGINAAEGADVCRERGAAFLVTDHHEQLTPLPEGVPAIDEKSIAQKEADARRGIVREDFCGAELARRVITELYERLGLSGEYREFLDSLYAYAGFASITDVVPMNAANHYTARRGIEIIRRGDGPWGILSRQCQKDGMQIREDTIGYYYGPMINACGRVEGSASRALRAFAYAFHGNEAASVREFAAMEQVNYTRREMSAEDEAKARQILEEEGLLGDPFLVVAGDEFREGINGLTAGALTNEFHVPAVVFSPVSGNPDLLKGSARAPEGFDLIGALKSHSGLIRAGGHAQAAGLQIRREDLPAVREILKKEAEGASFATEEEHKTDVILDAGELSRGQVEAFRAGEEMLMPFGPGFETPRIGFAGQAAALNTDRGSGTHAFITLEGLSKDRYPLQVVWWRHYQEALDICRSIPAPVTVIGVPDVDEFNGNIRIRIKAETVCQ